LYMHFLYNKKQHLVNSIRVHLCNSTAR
jgi:hypothetical protein